MSCFASTFYFCVGSVSRVKYILYLHATNTYEICAPLPQLYHSVQIAGVHQNSHRSCHCSTAVNKSSVECKHICNFTVVQKERFFKIKLT